MNKPSSTEPKSSENAGDDALALLSDNTLTEAPAPAETVEVAAPKLDMPSAIARLDAATAGLLMRSESDEPFRTVYWPLEKDEITASEVALYLTENAEADVQTESVGAFFENAVKVEAWMGDDEKPTLRSSRI